MAIDVLQAAKYLGKQSGWTLSQLEMQKILYLSHMLYYGAKGDPLIKGDFEAWDYGPVHPLLYHCLKYYGSRCLPEDAFYDIADLDKDLEELKIFNKMIRKYPHDSGAKLVGITHWSQGAWKKNYKAGVRGIVISRTDIIEEYENRQKMANSKEGSRQ